MKQQFDENGFILIKNFIPKKVAEQIRVDAERLFATQMLGKPVSEGGYYTLPHFEKALFDFFSYRLDEFVNCGKHIQHLASLHRLGIEPKIFDKLQQLGMTFPNICTRPVLFFNHKKLATEDIYHTVPAHQDWSSMQGSLNSVVVWFPLTDVDKDLGALKVVPGSHKKGLQATKQYKSFGIVNSQDYNFVDVEAKTGDALFFSSFLIHQSGSNITDKVRWSCHYRFNDMNEPNFIERGYPHPYIYKVKNCALKEIK